MTKTLTLKLSVLAILLSSSGDCDIDSKDVQDLINAEVDKIVAFVDVNKDGQISKDELYSAYSKHPEILEKLKNLA